MAGRPRERLCKRLCGRKSKQQKRVGTRGLERGLNPFVSADRGSVSSGCSSGGVRSRGRLLPSTADSFLDGINKGVGLVRTEADGVNRAVMCS